MWRLDDNGNSFIVRAGMTQADAEQLRADLEARWHKQTYWIAPDGSSGCG